MINMTEGIQPVDLGPVWDRMVNLVTENRRLHPIPKLIIGRGKWEGVLRRASDADRALLDFMHLDGQIIVTDFLPDPEVAYVLALPAEDLPPMPPPVRDGFEWEDRTTDRIRRVAGGPS